MLNISRLSFSIHISILVGLAITTIYNIKTLSFLGKSVGDGEEIIEELLSVKAKWARIS